jgi:hypothetical protein
MILLLVAVVVVEVVVKVLATPNDGMAPGTTAGLPLRTGLRTEVEQPDQLGGMVLALSEWRRLPV